MAVDAREAPVTPSPTAATPAGPPRRLRLGYAAGSLVTGMFTTLPGLLLLPYLTDTLGVGAALAGTVVLLPKVWNALLGPFVGRASDRTRGRWGARRPYVLFGGLAVALTFALMFAGPARGGAGAWFTAAGFFLTATAYAFFQVPYAALPAELTTRHADRIRLVSGRVAGIGVAALVAGAAGPALVDAGGGGIVGHRWVGVFGALVVTAGALGVFFGTGRVRGGPVLPSEPSLRRQLAVVRGNRPFMALLRCVVVQSLATGCLMVGAPYFSEHVLHDKDATGLVVAAFVAPNLLTMGLWSRFGTRAGNRAGYNAACGLFIAGCLLLLLAPVLPTAAVLAVMALAGTGHAGQLLFLYAMLPECTTDDTTRTGRRQAGVFSGVFATVETVGLALGPFAYGIVLQTFGYEPSATGLAAHQTSTTELGVLVGMALLPALATGAAVGLVRGYRAEPAG
ncbi:MFS transporter [Streptomyces sp. NRRL B-1568]|nr:MFS transporter [Streptomyces sp. NRRL B-1568]